MSNLLIQTGTNVDDSYLTIICPLLSLSSTDNSGTKVVSDISKTYIYDENNEYIQLIYTFELLAALLDSAPTNTGSGANIFQMAVGLQGTKTTIPDGTSYIIDAMIQTKGNSALSPTYTTKVSNKFVYFPVTNFFTVSSPGAPYTITITMTKKI